MGNIRFKCRLCDQPLSIEEDAAGLDIACPACGAEQPVPSPSASPHLARVETAEDSIPPPPPEPPVPPPPPPAAPAANDNKHYWAFISYSSKDKTWARWLHQAIETYGLPAELAGRHATPAGPAAPKRFRPVFRDRDELPASADLGAVIKQAISDSRYLIVICSPNAARSVWVNTEIENFISINGRDRVFAIIVEGEPNAGDERECFPPALRSFEPIAADARKHADGKGNAKLKLLAGMLGVRFDMLRQRDAVRRRKQFTIAASVGGAVVAALAVLSAIAIRESSAASDEKTKATRQRYLASMLKVQDAWEQGDKANFLSLLDAQRPQKRGDIDHRGWEWYYWYKQTRGEFRRLQASGCVLNSLWFSPDGQQLVTGCQEAMVKTWEVKTGREQQSLRLKGDPGDVDVPPGKKNLAKAWQGKVNILSSPDGRRLATSNPLDPAVRVWDAQTGKELMTLKGGAEVACVCFSPDGTRLAVGGYNAVTMWDLNSGKEMFTAKGDEDFESEFPTVCFSPDGNRLAAGYTASMTKIWDAKSGRLLHTFRVKGLARIKGDDNDISAVCFSPDGRRLATGGTDATVQVWDLDSNRALFTLKKHTDEVTAVTFRPDGRQLVSGSRDMTLVLWDLESGREVTTFSGHFNEITAVAFSPDGQILASCDDDGMVKLWRTATTEAGPMRLGTGPVVVSPDGSRLASVENERVRVFRAGDGGVLLDIPVAGPAGLVRFSRDGLRLAIGGTGERMAGEGGASKRRYVFRPTQVWDVQTARKVADIQRYATPQDNATIASLDFSPDGHRLALSGIEGSSAYLWNMDQDRLVDVRRHGVGAVQFSPDGRRLVVARYICASIDGGEQLTLESWYGDFNTGCFSPDGARYAVGGRIYDTANGKMIGSYQGDHPCFTRDGKRIAATTGRGVNLFDATGGQALLRLKGLDSEVSSIGFSKDGTSLLAGHADGTAEVWAAHAAE